MLIDINYYMIKCTALSMKWIGVGVTVDLFLVDACSLSVRLSAILMEIFIVFLSPAWKLPREYPPLAQHFKIVSITSVILQFDCV